MNYNKINNLVGWSVFLVALLVYLATVAPTASFWDCGEFIACSNELEVTHPPGAPLFLLLGRILAMLAPNPETIAFMVNLLSVLASAFTALFTCWTVTMLAKKGLKRSSWSEKEKILGGMGAGVIAGLSCIFADSIWFNAVEAEVYALSSFFTAIVVWLMFKWEARADEADHLKYIILIAYVMGLSTGVHLLNLLTIPALALVYFFRKYEFSWKGIMATLAISTGILAFIQYGILQTMISLAADMELLFTGTQTRAGVDTGGLGMAMGTGATVFAMIIFALLVGLIVYSQIKKKVILNTVLLSTVMILVGFSSYSIIFIRSNANPPVDMNNPENVFTFLSYMKREQYGDRPLLRGPMYNAQVKFDRTTGYPISDTVGMKYTLLDGSGKYVEDIPKTEYQYEDKNVVFFPRMYKTDRYAMGPYGYTNFVKNKGQNPNSPYDDKPTRAEDLRFFFQYQIGHMYLRYFFWNFVGRESDIRDDRWESGLEFADSSRYIYERKNNKAKNHYFFLPFFLGLLGMVWHFIAAKKDASIIGLLFFFTGIAIIVYLNQYPAQPRERDYSFAGSFQTFCMWIGLGFLFLQEVFRKYLGNKSFYVAAAIALIAPVLMATQNWDDHTRKGRYIDIEFAKNLLNTCEENAILFTGGDNDTFPLWYIQEVEGYRTDVRVVNLELLISDWYIDQMRSERNGTPGIPVSIDQKDLTGDAGLVINGFQSQKIALPLDPIELVKKGIFNAQEASLADSVMIWDFKARGRADNPYILRKDLIIMDVIKNVAMDGWKRPIYFANNMQTDNYLNLMDFFRVEGLAYRVVPLKKSDKTLNDRYTHGTLRPDILKRNITEKFLYTGLDNPDVYFDEHIRNLVINNYRNNFLRLAAAYADGYSSLGKEIAEIDSLMKEEGADVEALDHSRLAKAAKRQSYQEQAAEAIAFSRQVMPTDVEPQGNLYLGLQQAQVLETLKLMEDAAREYDEVAEVGIEQLQDDVNMGQPIDQNNLSMQITLLAIRHYIENGNEEKAQALAQRIEEVSASPIGKLVIEQLKGGQ